ncbi:PREDICTED: centrosomal protein of 290 kDa-like isoform X2 [Papilio xuthus]|uniref:Centrosomal protein of 290 kDa-like isoform X2 n=1 Tax=Papilio xuthus TaxID=66420 RepID=A0AAJ6Z3J3_PAPXU|nr:PREDICTED: centrosomal protein of 290 kDa-like isoform X2 [Papilio xuthus]
MVETDWRQILSLSQKELLQADKEELCESLSWMEVDDIELNFSDLKTLFRLAQDILKYKSEQVKNLGGELNAIHKKKGKKQSRNDNAGTSSNNALETITHQEQVIKANKDILEQLYADIAELEERKTKYKDQSIDIEKDSISSPDVLSEIDAKAQLENEIVQKNKHIRKLLGHVKILEEENTKFKEKITILKDKLKEATKIIEDLTEKLLASSNECNRIKETIGSLELAKSNLLDEISTLRQEILSKGINTDNVHEDAKTKIQHLKNLIKNLRLEIEKLTIENNKLKEGLSMRSTPKNSEEKQENRMDETRIKELVDKLAEASKEILLSVNVIDVLKSENKQLKSLLEETHNTDLDFKNESDDGKERKMINELKKKIKKLTATLQSTEQMLVMREKEVLELSSELGLLQSDDGIATLMKAVKNKKQQLKFKEEGIKSLIKDINNLTQVVNDLQIENETMRRQLNLSDSDKIPTEGILLEYHNLKEHNKTLSKEIRAFENELVTLEMKNREQREIISKNAKLLSTKETSISKTNNSDTKIKNDDKLQRVEEEVLLEEKSDKLNGNINEEIDVHSLIEENEGLRKGLEEIFNYLKDNCDGSTGVLAFECPSLEAVLCALEARHAAGWFAPHIATTLQLKAALGGKDALLTALQQSRKEVFNLMTQLSKESQKCAEMETKVHELESQMKTKAERKSDDYNANFGIFNSYVFDNENKEVNLLNKSELEKVSLNRNSLYEKEVRNALVYFRSKFEMLFDKMTEIAISTSDEKSKWLIQEENYKAQIENLKMSHISNGDEDHSDISAGLISSPNISFLERKCTYLEEMYKNIRTCYENINNEILENKKEKLKSTLYFETQIQNLVIIIVNLIEKIRCSMPEDLFWKQNKIFNEIVTKYRQGLNYDLMNVESKKIKQLDNDKINANDTTMKISQNRTKEDKNSDSKVEKIAPQTLQEIRSELDAKNKLIEQLVKRNTELQELQANLIDNTLASETKDEITSLKQNLHQLNDENKQLKDKFLEIKTQYDVVMSQFQHDERKRLNYETEINLLRHQILDLQSTGDNKAVIARLSNEILVAHLQASERHQTVESLKQYLNREKEMRENAEEALLAQQKILEMFTIKYENKFRYMHEVLQTLRLEYQGGLPMTSAENYLKGLKELADKTKDVDEKFTEIEDLRFNLMAKHSVYDQILNLTSGNCSENSKNCQHKLQLIVSQGTQVRELEHCNNKIQALEKTRKNLLERCNSLDKTLVMVSQGLRDTFIEENILKEKNNNNTKDIVDIESEDSQSDSDIGSSTKESGTFTLPKPRTTQLTYQINFNSNEKKSVATLTNFPERKFGNSELSNVAIQTNIDNAQRINKLIQTEKDDSSSELKQHIDNLEIANKDAKKKLSDSLSKLEQREKTITRANEENKSLHLKIQNLVDTNAKLISLNEDLQKSAELLKKEIEDFKKSHNEQCNKIKKKAKEDTQSLLESVERIEKEKNGIMTEYKQLLDRERNDNCENVKTLKSKLVALQAEIDRKASVVGGCNDDIIKQNIAKYSLKNAELENKCFKLENNLEDYKREVVSCQSELQRWKNLAAERLEKMQQMGLQLKERHNYEVESYKAENQHWLMQLNETQREHIELRTQLSEQKALHVKQLAEKDAQIEQLRTIVHNLKTQIMNMQTMLSVQDPSFDLSAIVEVEEASDFSQQGSDRLELKFDSTVDFHDMQDDFTKMSTSTMIWQEPIIERLRREKQLLAKQNGVLRRQIKAIAARERRSRLDAQNLKNQVFRISTSGSKAVCAETAALHNKIATLQAQLTSARRDNNSSVALWDKWKRAQQAAERWQARYEEKCQEVIKLEGGLNMARSAVARLEKEKRLLLSRLSEPKNEKLSAREKQDGEASEKRLSRSEYDPSEMQTVPVSTRALLERIEAQQRRIAALEVAEKGNEPLVSEYEKSLAEITSLKGQVLKLESTLLETQIRSPYKQEVKPELEYWKSYCNMLKEENSQLTLRVSSLESAPATAHQHRVNDLEQTVLTLRGLVSKLQAEQKSSATNIKRVDSRPTSGRSTSDKTRNQLESCKTEIANLKRTIQEKDALLERSKDMLRIAAEREDELLNENTFLRRQLEELTDYKRDSVSD